MKKERIDVLLVQQGLFETREQAKRAVMAGEILGENEERLDKPGMKVDPETKLHFKGTKMPYVSRGGLKLEKRLKSFIFRLRTRPFWISVLQPEDLPTQLCKRVPR